MFITLNSKGLHIYYTACWIQFMQTCSINILHETDPFKMCTQIKYKTCLLHTCLFLNILGYNYHVFADKIVLHRNRGKEKQQQSASFLCIKSKSNFIVLSKRLSDMAHEINLRQAQSLFSTGSVQMVIRHTPSTES